MKKQKKPSEPARPTFQGMPKFFDAKFAASALGNKQLWRYARAAKWIEPKISGNRMALYALSDFQRLVARIEVEGRPPATAEALSKIP